MTMKMAQFIENISCLHYINQNAQNFRFFIFRLPPKSNRDFVIAKSINRMNNIHFASIIDIRCAILMVKYSDLDRFDSFLIV